MRSRGRDQSGYFVGLNTAVLRLLVFGPANSSSAHAPLIKPQLAQWSHLSEPECEILFPDRLEKSKMARPVEGDRAPAGLIDFICV